MRCQSSLVKEWLWTHLHQTRTSKSVKTFYMGFHSVVVRYRQERWLRVPNNVSHDVSAIVLPLVYPVDGMRGVVHVIVYKTTLPREPKTFKPNYNLCIITLSFLLSHTSTHFCSIYRIHLTANNFFLTSVQLIYMLFGGSTPE